MLNDLWLYFSAVLSGWFWAAGALYGLIELILYSVGREMPVVTRRWRLRIMVFLLLWAQFLVWQEEHSRWNQEHNDRARIEGEMKKLQGTLNAKNETIAALKDQLTSRPTQIQMPPIRIPPAQVQVVRIPDSQGAWALTGEQVAMMTTTLRGFSGQTVNIFVHNATPETRRFSEAMVAAMRSAGLTVNVSHGTIFGGPRERVSMNVGTERINIANAIAKLLRDFGIVSSPISARKDDKNPAQFEIIIAPYSGSVGR